MSAVVRPDRARGRVALVAVLLAMLGIIGVMLSKGGASGPIASKSEPVPDATPVVAAPSPSTVVASLAVAAKAASSVAQPAPARWQASLQPAVVAATRVDSLAEYEVQMENWSCKGEQCVGNFRIPPTVPGSKRLSSVSQILDSLKADMARHDIDVSIGSFQPGDQGMAVSMQFTPTAALQSRVYTSSEIAAIRLESFEQGRESVEQAHNVVGQKTTH